MKNNTILENHLGKINKNSINQLVIFFEFIDKWIERFSKPINSYNFCNGIDENAFLYSNGKFENYNFEFIQFLYDEYISIDGEAKINEWLSLINVILSILFNSKGSFYVTDLDGGVLEKKNVSFRKEFKKIKEFKSKFLNHINILNNFNFSFDWKEFILLEQLQKISKDKIDNKGFSELYYSFLISNSSNKRNIIANVARGMIVFVDKYKNNEYRIFLESIFDNNYLEDYVKWAHCLRHNENEKGKVMNEKNLKNERQWIIRKS